MKRYETASSKVGLHTAAAATMQILKRLDTETSDDTTVNYKKLYYRAFNGLTTILEEFSYPNINNPILDQIVALQKNLEEQFITGK